LRVEQLEERCVLSAASPAAVLAAPNLFPYWLVHAAELAAAPKGAPQLVFLGDSILDAFDDGPGAPVWAARFAPLRAADYAIGGSTTSNVLWQIEHGILDGIAPRAVVLMIGTNNLALGQSPTDVAQGVAACVAAIHAKQPQASVVLLGVLPRGQNPADPLRTAVAQVNEQLARLDLGARVTFLNFGAAFLSADGTISQDVLYDYLHPARWGYDILAAGLTGPLSGLLVTPEAPKVATVPAPVPVVHAKPKALPPRPAEKAHADLVTAVDQVHAGSTLASDLVATDLVAGLGAPPPSPADGAFIGAGAASGSKDDSHGLPARAMAAAPEAWAFAAPLDERW
jgi:lysophospholipase L1-like esterase